MASSPLQNHVSADREDHRPEPKHPKLALFKHPAKMNGRKQ
jgi:hypothetical protein